MLEGIRLVVRTPHEVVFDDRVRSARVPTETGQVGLRPRGEPLVLVIEPGLVLLRGDAALRFGATVGGLLESSHERCTLYTPAAVVGASEDEVLGALERLLSAPDPELAARRQLVELEQRIVQQLRESPRLTRTGSDHGAHLAG
ncbi:MAG TPA: hypothetical protein VF653_04170 [Methylomirabilota bacterium]